MITFVQELIKLLQNEEKQWSSPVANPLPIQVYQSTKSLIYKGINLKHQIVAIPLLNFEWWMDFRLVFNALIYMLSTAVSSANVAEFLECGWDSMEKETNWILLHWLAVFWVSTNNSTSNIRLLDVAKHIIEKYDSMAENGKLLPVPCYPNCKNGIKVIAKKCGIDKNVTWHTARHSYATTVCLSNDVPIETLSKETSTPIK